MASLSKDKMLQVSSKEDNSRWQCSVVCKQTSIKTSWTEINKEFSAILEKQVVLHPFQCNKALLFCNGEEEAEWVARDKKMTANIKDEGLPFNLWTKEIFKQIGDACGGYLETDYGTENFLSLFAARIKVKSNDSGLIPEFVDVIGNFEAFYVGIHPSTLPSHYGDPKWKNPRIEKSAVAQTWISQRRERQKAADVRFPAKPLSAAMGKFSASDFKSIHMPRGPKDKNLEYQQKNPITFEALGSVELSLGWKKDLIKGGSSSTHNEKNVWENGKGTEAWKKEDWNTQKFVDSDRAIYNGSAVMGKNNKELRPPRVFKDTKSVGVDKVARAKSVESGSAVRDQLTQKYRRFSDGGLKSTNWAFMNFPVDTRVGGSGPRLLSSKCFEETKSSQEHPNQKLEMVLQEHQVETLPTEQDLETDLSIEEISRFEIGQSSGLSMVDKQPVLEHDYDFASAYFHSEEEDQAQVEDSEDSASQELNKDFFEENDDGLLDIFKESEEVVTREDNNVNIQEETVSMVEGTTNQKRVKTTKILSTMKLKLVPLNKTLVYGRRNENGKKGKGRRKLQ
ncbi:hypothetical protein M0R45_018084 [Rubus argutus]|uniref:DUF4283 domain-containing protein n=1 Tax=Rubus argutus TaxID=59490 RepID=A0AAW1Y001_RUBAR